MKEFPIINENIEDLKIDLEKYKLTTFENTDNEKNMTIILDPNNTCATLFYYGEDLVAFNKCPEITEIKKLLEKHRPVQDTIVVDGV